uniref:LRRCT domain-containing protein n=1 Tax=Xiphophorus couchianus TaxID=32473 RepID=A0A3B5MEI8_9TELE
MRPGRPHKSGMTRLLLLLVLAVSCRCCPDKCLCSLETVKCQNQDFVEMPPSLPANTKSLFLSELYLSGNEMEYVHAGAFKNLPNLVRLDLTGNPWRCNCYISDLLAWLKDSTQVVDKIELTCADPEAVRHRPLLQVQQSQLTCTGDMERVLKTSYVFLGLVLALIGVMFLLVGAAGFLCAPYTLEKKKI